MYLYYRTTTPLVHALEFVFLLRGLLLVSCEEIDQSTLINECSGDTFPPPG